MFSPSRRCIPAKDASLFWAKCDRILGKCASGVVAVPEVKSAKRVADLLQIIAQHPPGLTFSELLAASDLPKSSLHSLLTTLVAEQMLRYEPISRQYGLGGRLFEMAAAYSRQLQIVPAAWPFMLAIRDELDETVQLAVLDGPMVVYVAKVESSYPLQLASSVGSRLPAYATGIGKALLATLPEAQLAALYAEPLTQFTDRTPASLGDLAERLRQAKAEGYAVDWGEYSADVCCVAVPVIGSEHTGVAALSVSVPASRFDDGRRTNAVQCLRRLSASLSLQLGASQPDAWRDGDELSVPESRVGG